MNSTVKDDLHKIIDAIEDEDTLSILREDLATYTSDSNVDGLRPDQLKSLDNAIKEADSETDLQDWSEFKKSIKSKWKES